MSTTFKMSTFNNLYWYINIRSNLLSGPNKRFRVAPQFRYDVYLKGRPMRVWTFTFCPLHNYDFSFKFNFYFYTFACSFLWVKKEVVLRSRLLATLCICFGNSETWILMVVGFTVCVILTLLRDSHAIFFFNLYWINIKPTETTF